MKKLVLVEAIWGLFVVTALSATAQDPEKIKRKRSAYLWKTGAF